MDLEVRVPVKLLFLKTGVSCLCLYASAWEKDKITVSPRPVWAPE